MVASIVAELAVSARNPLYKPIGRADRFVRKLKGSAVSRIYKKQIKKVNGKNGSAEYPREPRSEEPIEQSRDSCLAARHSGIRRIPGEEWMK
jgi:hypothetical protein